MDFRPPCRKSRKFLSLGACLSALGLALCGVASAQQDQPAQTLPAQQNPNRPPISVDRVPQNSPKSAQENRPAYSQRNPPYSNGSNDEYAPPPALLTIPKGTVLSIRLNEPLSSDHNQVGDQFSGVLDRPIVVDGWVVARRGQTVMGQVKSVKKAGRVKGVSQLGVELTDVTLVNGEQAPILSELWKASGGTSHGADAATIGGTTALGALIGSAADWGTGAAIGAGAGAVAGIGAVLLTRGRPTILEPESQLTFRLVDPVRVNTTHSQQAFVPVSQEDFENGRVPRPGMRAGNGYYGYPGYGPVPCGYGYPYPCYYYPGYSFGLYTGYGWWGPRYYGHGFYGRGFYGHHGFRRY